MTTESTTTESIQAAKLARKERNRRNAAHSTGPRTPEGKSKSRLNAWRHGITAQLTIMPPEDAAAYQEFTDGLMTSLDPVGADEAIFAQAVVDARWQLGRTQAIENNLLFFVADPDQDEAGDETTHDETPEHSSQSQISRAETTARTFFNNLNKFDLMGRYTARLSRLVIQNHDKLVAMQAARRQAEKEEHLHRLRNAPVNVETEIMPFLSERLQARMKHNLEKAARQKAAQSTQQPDPNSGFVSQQPVKPAKNPENLDKTDHPQAA